MKLVLRLVFALLGLAACIPATAEYRDPMEYFIQPFLGDLKSEIADARANGRKGVVVMYHFEECPYCRRMRKEVLSRPDVQDWYHREFTVVAIDILGDQPITGLDGRTLPEKEYARSVRIRGTPTFDFYGTDGSRLYRYVGGIYVPEDFLLLGRFVVAGAFRNSTFEAYLAAAHAHGGRSARTAK